MPPERSARPRCHHRNQRPFARRGRSTIDLVGPCEVRGAIAPDLEADLLQWRAPKALTGHRSGQLGCPPLCRIGQGDTRDLRMARRSMSAHQALPSRVAAGRRSRARPPEPATEHPTCLQPRHECHDLRRVERIGDPTGFPAKPSTLKSPCARGCPTSSHDPTHRVRRLRRTVPVRSCRCAAGAPFASSPSPAAQTVSPQPACLLASLDSRSSRWPPTRPRTRGPRRRTAASARPPPVARRGQRARPSGRIGELGRDRALQTRPRMSPPTAVAVRSPSSASRCACSTRVRRPVPCLLPDAGARRPPRPIFGR